MQITIRIQTQFRRRVIASRQLLTGITKGLEVTDGIGIGKRCHQMRRLPLLPA